MLLSNARGRIPSVARSDVFDLVVLSEVWTTQPKRTLEVCVVLLRARCVNKPR